MKSRKRSKAGTVLLAISAVIALYSLVGAVVDTLTRQNSRPPLLASAASAVDDHLINAGLFGIAPIWAILRRKKGGVRTAGEMESPRAGLHTVLAVAIASVFGGVLLLLWAFPQINFSYYFWENAQPGAVFAYPSVRGEWQLFCQESPRLLISSPEYGSAHVGSWNEPCLWHAPDFVQGRAIERRVGIGWEAQFLQSLLIMAYGTLAFWTVHRKQAA